VNPELPWSDEGDEDEERIKPNKSNRAEDEVIIEEGSEITLGIGTSDEEEESEKEKLLSLFRSRAQTFYEEEDLLF
jgi:hypothetical protein